MERKIELADLDFKQSEGQDMSGEKSSMDDGKLSVESIIKLINNRQSNELKSAFESESFQDVNNDSYNESLLMRACMIGDLEIVKILLAYGADISYESPHYSYHTALSLACRLGYLSIVELLLKHKADPNLPREHLPLIEACDVGNIAIVELLLKNNAEIDKFSADFDTCDVDEFGDPEHKDGPNALMMACAMGAYDLVELLIKYGADINVRLDDSDGFASITYASRYYRWNVVKLLLANGADINDEGTGQYGTTPLMYACAEGNMEIILFLLDCGANINEGHYGHSSDYHSPLSFACKHSHIEVVKFILGHKDFTARDTVIHELVMACDNNRKQLITILLEYLKDIDTVNMNGNNALCQAVCGGRVRAVKRLLALGAKADAISDRGSTLLTAAAYHISYHDAAEAIIKLLIKYGADVNMIDNAGNTVLMECARFQHLPFIKILLDYGADVTATNHQNKSVYDMLYTPWSCHASRLSDDQVAHIKAVEGLCKQYEESNRRDCESEDKLLK